MKYFILAIISLWTFSTLQADKPDPTYAAAYIAPQLKENAHTVVREYKEVFKVNSLSNAVTRVKVAYTILNKKSDANIINLYYDKMKKVKWIKGAIYDSRGKLIKKIKKSNLIDHSAISSSLYADNRALSYKAPQTSYPYTIAYEYEETTTTTMWYPTWVIQDDYGVSVEKSHFQIILPKNYKFRYKVKNVELKLKESTTKKGNTSYQWIAFNLKALEKEPFSPSYRDIFPMIRTAPNSFKIDDHRGDMSSWENLGRFNYDLNKDRDVLSPTMAAKVKELTKDATTQAEKINILYKYMQDNMRYVSVQLGIGGWQTFDAQYVEKNKYGDCKALTNFMKSMLKAVNITAHPALIRMGRSKSTQDEDFPSASFNHVILYVPSDSEETKEPTWLECTSSNDPAGYIGEGTNDRFALVYSEKGGKLIKTPMLTPKENLLMYKTTIDILPNGDARIKSNQTEKGYQQDRLRQMSFYGNKEEQEKYLRESLDLPNFKINEYNIEPNKTEPITNTTLDILVNKYVSKAGKRIFIRPNAINRISYIPSKVSERQYPIVGSNSFLDKDEVIVNIPEGYKVESVPTKAFELKSEFGQYEITITQKENQLIYNRVLMIKNFNLPKEKYKDLRKFFKEVSKMDKLKVVLVQQ